MALPDVSCHCNGCSRWFESEQAHRTHWWKRPRCWERHDKMDTAQPVASIEPIGAVSALSADRPALFRKDERLDAALKMTTECRLEKLMPDSWVQHIKDELEASVLPVVRQQLKQHSFFLIAAPGAMHACACVLWHPPSPSPPSPPPPSPSPPYNLKYAGAPTAQGPAFAPLPGTHARKAGVHHFREH